MKMKDVSGIICLVADLDRSIEFYKTLGFEFKKQIPDVSATVYLNRFWVELLLKNAVITEEFKPDIEVTPKGAGQYIHISVDNVNEFYENVVAKGLEPSNAPQNFPWGHREFVLSDPDGYKLVFFNKIR